MVFEQAKQSRILEWINILQKITIPGSFPKIEEEFEDQTDDQLGLAPLPDGKVTCLKCGKTLSNKGSGQRHYATSHQPNQPVRCNICQKVCKNRLAYEAHLRQMHGVTVAMMKNVIRPPTPPINLKFLKNNKKERKNWEYLYTKN
mgnify:CR=1 FL=1